MLLSIGIGCCVLGAVLETDDVEYWLLCCRRMLLSIGRCVEHESTAGSGRAGGGRLAGRDFNRTPKDSVLQRHAVEYWLLCWRRMLLSTDCWVADGCC